MPLEYTIEIGWDAHVHAGYANYVTSTPEEAIDLRGTDFHPDCDSVVRREVGTEQWTYHPDDQKFDRAEKVAEYRAALAERQRRDYRPKHSSALPSNRRVNTHGRFLTDGAPLVTWNWIKGEFSHIRRFPQEET